MISIRTLFEVSCKSIKGKFLIHEHHANRVGLHYDLRIEHDCNLKSWASRKLPDLIDGTSSKILLIAQPDHDPSWFDWEGEIEDGYGAGKVIIWDKGSYDTQIWSGHMILTFHGTKINGTYVILPYDLKKNHYLMFKKKSE